MCDSGSEYFFYTKGPTIRCARIFFHEIFPCANFFLYFARPPHKFSNGPSLMKLLF